MRGWREKKSAKWRMGSWGAGTRCGDTVKKSKGGGDKVKKSKGGGDKVKKSKGGGVGMGTCGAWGA